MYKYLLLIVILFKTSLSFCVKSWSIINIENWIKIHRLTKTDILNNKDINVSVKIKDYIIRYHNKLKSVPGNRDNIKNLKSLDYILKGFGLKYEDLIPKS